MLEAVGLHLAELGEADGAEEERLSGSLADAAALVHGALEVVAVCQPQQVAKLMRHHLQEEGGGLT